MDYIKDISYPALWFERNFQYYFDAGHNSPLLVQCCFQFPKLVLPLRANALCTLLVCPGIWRSSRDSAEWVWSKSQWKRWNKTVKLTFRPVDGLITFMYFFGKVCRSLALASISLITARSALVSDAILVHQRRVAQHSGRLISGLIIHLVSRPLRSSSRRIIEFMYEYRQAMALQMINWNSQ